MADPPNPAFRHWPLLLAVLPALAALLLLGNDANWDLRNYHLYGPHAWLHGRAAIDVAPAQMQGYHNPLLDLPMYLLAMAGAPPKLIGLWLALPAMLAIWCLLRLHERLSPTPPGICARVVLALLALTGAATWSTLGLSMDDAFVAAGMLAALWLLADTPGELPASSARIAGAGLLAGATAGLKLSGAFYCPAFALALAFLPGAPAERLRRLALLSIGGTLGFLATYGWWGWSLWQAHANPFFPYFNDWFRSPDIAAYSFADPRFRPQGPLELLLAPVRLLARSQRFSEGGLKDPRMLLALLGFAWLAWRARTQSPALRARFRLLLAFVAASILAWGLQAGIYRYAMAIELLGSLALVLVLARLPRWRGAAMVLAVVLVSADTRRPDWHRVQSNAGPVPTLENGSALPDDALVVTAGGAPLGYLALALPDAVPMLGLHNNLIQPGDCSGLPRRVAQRIAVQRGPIYLATTGDPDEQQTLSREYGLEADGACLRVHAGIGDALLCPQRRTSAPPPRCR